MVSVKRARTSKASSETTVEPVVTTDTTVVCDEPVAKKRGRKPRGSKIIEGCGVANDSDVIMPNVIVHFRCSLAELGCAINGTDASQGCTSDFPRYAEVDQTRYSVVDSTETRKQKAGATGRATANSVIAPSDGPYGTKAGDLGFTYVDELDKQEILLDVKDEDKYAFGGWLPNGDPRKQKHASHLVEGSSVDAAEINEKISEMEVNFHNNNTNGKRSSCFWDTCPFDTPPFYIPKAIDANDVRPYGCFCSLNCALAYLQTEDIDSSAKFERRQLMFNLYSKVVGNKTFVKPAPNPRYTLDKYYGNLSIQQWRSLLAGDRMLLIVDKPLTPELPQLHTETTDRFLTMGNTTSAEVAQYGQFKIRKVAPKQSKGAIVAERFGAAK